MSEHDRPFFHYSQIFPVKIKTVREYVGITSFLHFSTIRESSVPFQRLIEPVSDCEKKSVVVLFV